MYIYIYIYIYVYESLSLSLALSLLLSLCPSFSLSLFCVVAFGYVDIQKSLFCHKTFKRALHSIDYQDIQKSTTNIFIDIPICILKSLYGYSKEHYILSTEPDVLEVFKRALHCVVWIFKRALHFVIWIFKGALHSVNRA